MTETFPRGQRKSRGWSPAAADSPFLMRHISTCHFTFINSGAIQQLEKEMALDYFQTVSTEANLKSEVFLWTLCSRSQENIIHKTNLYCSNLKFSGVLRGTQGGHAEKCVKL